MAGRAAASPGEVGVPPGTAALVGLAVAVVGVAGPGVVADAVGVTAGVGEAVDDTLGAVGLAVDEAVTDGAEGLTDGAGVALGAAPVGVPTGDGSGDGAGAGGGAVPEITCPIEVPEVVMLETGCPRTCSTRVIPPRARPAPATSTAPRRTHLRDGRDGVDGGTTVGAGSGSDPGPVVGRPAGSTTVTRTTRSLAPAVSREWA